MMRAGRIIGVTIALAALFALPVSATAGASGGARQGPESPKLVATQVDWSRGTITLQLPSKEGAPAANLRRVVGDGLSLPSARLVHALPSEGKSHLATVVTEASGHATPLIGLLPAPQDQTPPPGDTYAPAVPVGHVASPTHVELFWQPVPGITKYTVLRNRVEIGVASGTQFIDDDVTPGLRYEYTVEGLAYHDGDEVGRTYALRTALVTPLPLETSSPAAVVDELEKDRARLPSPVEPTETVAPEEVLTSSTSADDPDDYPTYAPPPYPHPDWWVWDATWTNLTVKTFISQSEPLPAIYACDARPGVFLGTDARGFGSSFAAGTFRTQAMLTYNYRDEREPSYSPEITAGATNKLRQNDDGTFTVIESMVADTSDVDTIVLPQAGAVTPAGRTVVMSITHEVNDPYCDLVTRWAGLSYRLDNSYLYQNGSWVASGFVERYPSYEIYTQDDYMYRVSADGETPPRYRIIGREWTVFRRLETDLLCLVDACPDVNWSSTW